MTLPQNNGESIVLYSPTTCTNYDLLLQYRNMVFLDGNLGELQFGTIMANIFVSTKRTSISVDKSREVFAKYYKLVMSRIPNAGNDIIEIAQKMIANNPDYNLVQLVFTIFVCAELGFISYKSDEVVELGHVTSKNKKELSSSKFYNLL